MLLGHTFGSLLAAALSLSPLLHIHEELGREDGDDASTASLKRWLAYCVCFSFFVLPVVCLVPVWMLRNEVVVLLLVFLTHQDAEGAWQVYRRWIAPAIAPLKATSRKMSCTTMRDWVCEEKED